MKQSTGEYLAARAFLQRYLSSNLPSAGVLYLGMQIEVELGDSIRIITPREDEARGCQISLMVTVEGLDGKAMFDALEKNGVTTDWREPNVIRVAPVPLYNSFEDAFHFVRILKACLQ